MTTLCHDQVQVWKESEEQVHGFGELLPHFHSLLTIAFHLGTPPWDFWLSLVVGQGP